MYKMEFAGEDLLCPIKYCMGIAGGKWKTSILCILANGKPQRNSTIKRKLGEITNAMLSQSLQQLEKDGMIERIQYNEVPPRVEYMLTEDGKSIIPILLSMARWGSEHMIRNAGERPFCDECVKIK